MKYKYELHCHTGCVSRCGRIEPEEIVKLYKEKGYSGIVVTDHYSPMTFTPNWCPQKQIDFYLSGYRRMKAAAGSDFTVLLGIELRHYFTANDYLIYGVDEDFLYNSGNLMTVWEKKVFKIAHERGYLVFQAHPFRVGIRRCNPDFIDGVEIYNGKTDKISNDKARDWAYENNKLVCSGSDFHTLSNLAKGGIITDRKIESNADLLEILRTQNFELIEKY
ncbi:MAG: PHP domain-containing protein [Acetobacter sp.]|nr:PHP domain-containing protein [Bacteroides sp.]MCM1341138.1 PHP domain-containing protein [Acetobacter sp.]MCM1433528.1 PHP domain-containing protein [Clostridiales bacterium]